MPKPIGALRAMPLDASLLQKILSLLLRPVAAYAVRHGVKLQGLIEVLKLQLVEAAQAQLERDGEKVNTSRISVVTGLQRKDVVRLYSPQQRPAPGVHDLITKIIGQWRSDPEFSAGLEQPRSLTYGAASSEFQRLVSKVSTDVGAGAVLFELERIGAVCCSEGTVELQVESYVPSADYVRGFEIYSLDSADLLSAVEENLSSATSPPNLHIRTSYDRVRKDQITRIRAWLMREGLRLHARARDLISRYDQDINPVEDYRGEVVEVVLGSFGIIKDPDMTMRTDSERGSKAENEQ